MVVVDCEGRDVAYCLGSRVRVDYLSGSEENLLSRGGCSQLSVDVAIDGSEVARIE